MLPPLKYAFLKYKFHDYKGGQKPHHPPRIPLYKLSASHINRRYPFIINRNRRLLCSNRDNRTNDCLLLNRLIHYLIIIKSFNHVGTGKYVVYFESKFQNSELEI